MSGRGRQIGRVRQIGLWGGPVLALAVWLLPAPAGLGPEAQRTAGVAAWMAVWWITEAVPIYVTGLIPLVLFPLLKVLKAGALASAYGHHFIYLFMGGFMLARAVERWNLHERIALTIVHRVGASPRRLVLGMMTATALLSMWISNTATALIMLPIGLAILAEAASLAGTRLEDDPDLASLATCLMLAIAYGANIGGMGTLVGTPPNVVFASQMAEIFPNAPGVTFLAWMEAALPLVVVFVPLAWAYLTWVAFPVRIKELPGGRRVVAERLAALPPLKGPERRVAVVFGLTALAWIFRAPIDFGFATLPGWAGLLGVSGWVNDTTVAIGAALVLFVVPSGPSMQGPGTTTGALLDWETARTIPWGVLILFGGGLALASGVGDSGLSDWIGGLFTGLSGMPMVLMVLMVCLVMTFLTEITSNTAISTLFMPVLAAAAVSIGEHPALLMFPAALSASCAFMMPVATPPNAIVFGSGYVRIPQMARAGFVLNLIGALLITVLVYGLGIPVFGIQPGQLPAWAAPG
jgi:sodium-dependent dicarboxylate transporter 2/3/5